MLYLHDHTSSPVRFNVRNPVASSLFPAHSERQRTPSLDFFVLQVLIATQWLDIDLLFPFDGNFGLWCPGSDRGGCGSVLGFLFAFLMTIPLAIQRCYHFEATLISLQPLDHMLFLPPFRHYDFEHWL